MGMFHGPLDFLGNWKPLVRIRTTLHHQRWLCLPIRLDFIQVNPAFTLAALPLSSFLVRGFSALSPIPIGLHQVIASHHLLFCKHLFIEHLFTSFLISQELLSTLEDCPAKCRRVGSTPRREPHGQVVNPHVALDVSMLMTAWALLAEVLHNLGLADKLCPLSDRLLCLRVNQTILALVTLHM